MCIEANKESLSWNQSLGERKVPLVQLRDRVMSLGQRGSGSANRTLYADDKETDPTT